MKILNIIGIIFVFAMIPVSAYYIDEVSSARISEWFNTYDYGYYSYSPSAADLTIEATVYMFLMVLLYVAIYVINLARIKTVISRVIGVIGLSFTAIMLVISFGMLSAPSSISFDEAGAFYVIYAIINLAFCIVLLMQAIQTGRANQEEG